MQKLSKNFNGKWLQLPSQIGLQYCACNGQKISVLRAYLEWLLHPLPTILAFLESFCMVLIQIFLIYAQFLRPGRYSWIDLENVKTRISYNIQSLTENKKVNMQILEKHFEKKNTFDPWPWKNRGFGVQKYRSIRELR